MTTRKLALAALVVALPGSAALAAGLTGGDGRSLVVEAQTLRVTVEGPVATTELLQTFRNDSPTPMEAVYDFVLPPRATFGGLSIWVDGKEIQGEVVPRARAEEVYSEVTGVDLRPREEKATAAEELAVVIRRDPALLQHRGGRELRLRVAPVPARGQQKVRIRYVEPAGVVAGEGRYSFPRGNTAPLDAEVLLKGKLARTRADGLLCEDLVERRLVRVATPPGGLACDVDVRWTLEPGEGPTLDVAAGGSSALLTLTPWLPAAARLPRNVVLVLDASRGLAGQRDAALAAARAILGSLRPDDRFDAVAFDLAARSCAGQLVPATAAAAEQAIRFLGEAPFTRAADPRTALVAVARVLRATASPRPLDLVLVTGPGFSDSDELVREVELAARERGVRVFALELGAGPSPQAALTRLCETTGGAARCGSARELASLAALPVLRAPSLRLEGVELEEVHPTLPPVALTDGTPVTIAGRVKKPGAGRALLEGTLADGRRMSWAIPFEVPARGDFPDADRLWARAAADDVLGDLARPSLSPGERSRLEGELARVSLRGPILTRATSLLVLESEAMFEEFGISRANAARVTAERAAQDERRARLDREVLERRQRAEAADDVVAMAEPRKVWTPPRLDFGGGGGRGGGAGEPAFVAVALALAARTLRRGRAG